MKNFAVIDSETNTVIDLVMDVSKSAAETVTGKTCVEYTRVRPGYTYVDGVFAPPA
jgi:hypothetical protein